MIETFKRFYMKEKTALILKLLLEHAFCANIYLFK